MSLSSFLRFHQAVSRTERAGSAHARRHLHFETCEDRRMLSLTPAVNFTTEPATPSAIVTADFNNDGNLDLATCANALTGSFSVLLGDGAGGFGAAQRTVLGTGLNALAAADINNDDTLDLVLGVDSSGFYTLIGNGDGTFQPAEYTPGGGMATVADFNNDGNIDVLVTWLDGDWATHLQPYFGNGQGDFVAGFDAWYWGWGGMAPVDLNNDGRPDVATGDGSVFLANAWASFDLVWWPATPLSGGAVATGDFTGEGHADVVVAGNGVAVLLGNGDGTLDAPVHYSTSGYYSAVATADFNADGKLDAVVTDYNLGMVNVMLGNGDGTLRYGGAWAVGTAPGGLTIGDFNGDGRPDVAVSNAGSKTVSVLLNDGQWETLPPPPTTLAISDTTVTEGDAGTLNANFVVTLSQPALVDVTVRYDTANFTATAATDYVAASGTLTIPAGQTSRSVTVAIRGDLLYEPTESFTVNLTNPTNALLADSQGIGTIIDNDPRPTIRINDVSRTEGNAKTTLFTFTVSLSAAAGEAVTLNYATANGTAIAGSDYQAKTGSLTFAPGETAKTVTVAVLGEKLKEANETFFVNLSGAVGADIVDSQGLGTILDDDSGKGGGGGPRGKASFTSLVVDAAIEELMFPGRRKHGR
jgi:hypothetical protein